MNNIEDMQKAFEDQKFKVFSPFKCDISKNEDGNYVDDTTIFAFAWFCRGIASQAQQTESKPSIEDVQSLVDSSEIMLKWCVKNVQQWNFSEYDWLHSATEKVKSSLPPAPEGDKP